MNFFFQCRKLQKLQSVQRGAGIDEPDSKGVSSEIDPEEIMGDDARGYLWIKDLRKGIKL